MFIIGITGSIGSGKSTVTRILADIAGVPVVDADHIARELVRPGEQALSAIVKVFGDDMLLSDGTLDRKKLGALIFSNVKARKKLNSIMFPLIRKRVKHYFDAYASVGTEYLIYDAPLLYESGTQDLVDYVAVIYVPREVQIERIKHRNDLTDAEAAARVDAQPEAKKTLGKKIDYLLRNTMNLNSLGAVVSGMWKNIQRKKNTNALDNSKQYL